jgi:hypothetical protein
MDNYFQIIIYLIIIFAFLSSIFKKKSKEEPPKTSSDPTPPVRRKPYTPGRTETKSQDEYDILNEIESLFKGEKTYPTQARRTDSDLEKAEMRRVPESEHTRDKEWHTEDSEWHSEDKEWHSESEEWHEESSKEHELDKSWHTITQFKRPAPIDAAIEKEAEKFERMLADRNKEIPYPFNELRKKLYSPETLQEFVVVSEIIGKPKYLRR